MAYKKNLIPKEIIESNYEYSGQGVIKRYKGNNTDRVISNTGGTLFCQNFSTKTPNKIMTTSAKPNSLKNQYYNTYQKNDPLQFNSIGKDYQKVLNKMAQKDITNNDKISGVNGPGVRYTGEMNDESNNIGQKKHLNNILTTNHRGQIGNCNNMPSSEISYNKNAMINANKNNGKDLDNIENVEYLMKKYLNNSNHHYNTNLGAETINPENKNTSLIQNNFKTYDPKTGICANIEDPHDANSCKSNILMEKVGGRNNKKAMANDFIANSLDGGIENDNSNKNLGDYPKLNMESGLKSRLINNNNQNNLACYIRPANCDGSIIKNAVTTNDEYKFTGKNYIAAENGKIKSNYSCLKANQKSNNNKSILERVNQQSELHNIESKNILNTNSILNSKISNDKNFINSKTSSIEKPMIQNSQPQKQIMVTNKFQPGFKSPERRNLFGVGVSQSPGKNIYESSRSPHRECTDMSSRSPKTRQGNPKLLLENSISPERQKVMLKYQYEPKPLNPQKHSNQQTIGVNNMTFFPNIDYLDNTNQSIDRLTVNNESSQSRHNGSGCHSTICRSDSSSGCPAIKKHQYYAKEDPPLHYKTNMTDNIYIKTNYSDATYHYNRPISNSSATQGDKLRQESEKLLDKHLDMLTSNKDGRRSEKVAIPVSRTKYSESVRVEDNKSIYEGLKVREEILKMGDGRNSRSISGHIKSNNRSKDGLESDLITICDTFKTTNDKLHNNTKNTGEFILGNKQYKFLSDVRKSYELEQKSSSGNRIIQNDIEVLQYPTVNSRDLNSGEAKSEKSDRKRYPIDRIVKMSERLSYNNNFNSEASNISSKKIIYQNYMYDKLEQNYNHHYQKGKKLGDVQGNKITNSITKKTQQEAIKIDIPGYRSYENEKQLNPHQHQSHYDCVPHPNIYNSPIDQTSSNKKKSGEQYHKDIIDNNSNADQNRQIICNSELTMMGLPKEVSPDCKFDQFVDHSSSRAGEGHPNPLNNPNKQFDCIEISEESCKGYKVNKQLFGSIDTTNQFDTNKKLFGEKYLDKSLDNKLSDINKDSTEKKLLEIEIYDCGKIETPQRVHIEDNCKLERSPLKDICFDPRNEGLSEEDLEKLDVKQSNINMNKLLNMRNCASMMIDSTREVKPVESLQEIEDKPLQNQKRENKLQHIMKSPLKKTCCDPRSEQLDLLVVDNCKVVPTNNSENDLDSFKQHLRKTMSISVNDCNKNNNVIDIETEYESIESNIYITIDTEESEQIRFNELEVKFDMQRTRNDLGEDSYSIEGYSEKKIDQKKANNGLYISMETPVSLKESKNLSDEEIQQLGIDVKNESDRKCQQTSNGFEEVDEFYEDGSRYIGTKVNKKRYGKGVLQLSNGSKYNGDWKDDQMYGIGELFYDNGKLAYKGGFLDNKVDGYGTMYNDIYNNKDDTISGKPLIFSVLSNNSLYNNEASNKKQNFPENAGGPIDYANFESVKDNWICYEGTFKDDQKNGLGKWKFQNGDYYKGEFSDDKVHGTGFYFNCSKNEKVFGVWSENNVQSIF